MLNANMNDGKSLVMILVSDTSRMFPHPTTPQCPLVLRSRTLGFHSCYYTTANF
jgi:hypothetical protein